MVYDFWSATPPTAGPVPDPEDLAREAVAAMGLEAVDIGIVPDDAPDSLGVVGMPVWMWAQAPSESTWGPITRTASAGGVTVTATATVQKVDWSMGDGTTVACTSPGTPYQNFFADHMSPDCGHRYTESSSGQPRNVYSVTATSHWIVDWTGGGTSGQITLDLEAATQLRVGEVQVLVVR